AALYSGAQALPESAARPGNCPAARAHLRRGGSLLSRPGPGNRHRRERPDKRFPCRHGRSLPEPHTVRSACRPMRRSPASELLAEIEAESGLSLLATNPGALSPSLLHALESTPSVSTEEISVNSQRDENRGSFMLLVAD